MRYDELMRTCAAMTVFGALLALAPTAGAAPDPNRLTKEEKKAGFTLLYDGRTGKGWRGFHAKDFPPAGWVTKGGELRRDPAAAAKAGDIITRDKYVAFEMLFEWKIAPGGNSGVKYFVDEALGKPDSTSGLGFEYQILDDERHPDAKLGADGNHRTGALYDLIPPASAAAKPAGEWNQARLLVNGTHVEHWLNGVKVVEFEKGSPDLQSRLAKSKYKDIAGFAAGPSGHILLQDHGDAVAFRGLKLRRIGEAPAPK